MRLVSAVVVFTSFSILSGCFQLGPALHRLAELEVEVRSDGSVQRGTTTYSYLSDGKLEEIEDKLEGQFYSRQEIEYDSTTGKISEVTVVEEDEDPVRWEYEWVGDLLDERSNDAETSWVARYSYFNEDPDQLDTIEMAIDGPGGSGDVEQTMGYDDQGRVKSLNVYSTIRPDNGATSSTILEAELRWNEEGQIERVSTFEEDAAGNSETDEVSYSYNEDGRVDEAEGEDGSRTTVSYDAEGRIAEVELRSDGTTLIVEYTYEEGVTDGFVHTPTGLDSFWDLEGRTMELLPGYSEMILP